MVYREMDFETINLKLNVLSERISAMEDFKKQVISALGKVSNNLIELKQKKEKYDELVTEIDRIKGKLEVISEFKDQLSETSRLFSEQIGELRTMILDREKSFSKIEMGFERINEIVKEIEPKAISRELNKKEEQITELSVKIDKMEKMYDELTKRTAEVRKFLEKIKSFENLVEISNKIKKTELEIEESKSYIDRVASKLEAIFEDLNEKVLSLDEKSRKINKIDELLKELTPTVDKLEIAIENKADKRDLESIKTIGVTGKLREKIENMEREIEELKKLRNQLKDIGEIKSQLSFLGPEEVRRRDQIRGEISALEEEIEEIEKSFENNKIKEEDYRKKVEERRKKIRELELELQKFEGRSLSGKIEQLEGEIRKVREILKEENIQTLIDKMKELNKKMEYIEDFKQKIELMKPKSLSELLSEKERLSQELRHLNEQYKEGYIDRETFESLFERKQRNLIQILSLIREKEKQGSVLQEIKKVHSSLSDFREILPKIKENTREIQELRNELKSIKEEKPPEEETIMKIKEVLDSLKICELPGDIEEIKTKISNLSKYIELELKFAQLTSALQYIESESTVLSYIYKIKIIVSELKSINKWSKEKEEYLKKLYSYLTTKFKDNKEIRELYYSLA